MYVDITFPEMCTVLEMVYINVHIKMLFDMYVDITFMYVYMTFLICM